MQVISVVNMKGGVGKTTVSVALAETLAAVKGRSVLVVDLDPQASCTFAILGETRFEDMRLQRRHVAGLFGSLLTEPANARAMTDFIWRDATRVRTRAPLAMIGSLPQLQRLERDIVYTLAARGEPRDEIEDVVTERLATGLKEVRHEYDLVVFDCPPGVSTFTEAAVRVADAVISPVTLEYLPVLGLEAFVLQTIRPLRRRGVFNGKNFILFNQVRGGGEEARFADLCAMLSRDLGDDMQLMDTRLPQDAAFAKLVIPPEFPTPYGEKYGGAGPMITSVVDELLDRIDATVKPSHHLPPRRFGPVD